MKSVVETYIQTAEPVGSGFLVEEQGLSLSGATVRNEMRELEEAGYLTHPHTSAGRVPTEIGYRYYVMYLMQPVALAGSVKDTVARAIDSESDRQRRRKAAAKAVAELTHNAAIVVFDPESLYYTGLSYLFAQPEFRVLAGLMNVGDVLDQTEERVGELLDDVSGETPTILIGSDNPLGNALSVIAVRTGRNSLFSIVGPLRMDYARTVSLVTFVHDVV